jgi:hypothetical protein
MTEENKQQVVSTFHTQANLSQALFTILRQHYGEIAKDSPLGPDLPSFIAEALHMICHNVANIGNGNPYDLKSWENINLYSKEVTNIITSAQSNNQQGN